MRKSIQAHMPVPFHRPAPTLAVSRSFALTIGTPSDDSAVAHVRVRPLAPTGCQS